MPITLSPLTNLDIYIQVKRKVAAIQYTAGFFARNKDTIKTRVPKSFTLGSSLCIGDSVG